MDNLSPEIAALMTAARARAVSQGRIASDGRVCRTVEAMEHYEAVLRWHASGKPADELKALKAWEKRLRREDKF